MKICLDAGHGGADSGACANGIVEKDANLIVAQELQRLLILREFTVFMTRTGDQTMSLRQRTDYANATGAAYFLSIHHNAGGGTGFDVIHSIHHGVGETLARLIADEFREIGQHAHGVGVWDKQGNNGDYFAVIRDTHMPAVISEFAFVDSADAKRIDTVQELLTEAGALCQAIMKIRTQHSPA
jgi:N-acetylmuramoyl-L-alanine amidase